MSYFGYMPPWLANAEQMEYLRQRYQRVLGKERGGQAFRDAVERSKKSPSRMYDFVKRALDYGDYGVGLVPVTFP